MHRERTIECPAITINGRTAPAIQFPTALAVTASGDLIVADGSSRIFLISKDGAFKKTIAEFGRAAGEVRHPMGVAVSGTGADECAWVADTQNSRLQKVRLVDGQVQAVATNVRHRPTAPGPLTLGEPHGVAFAGPLVYVSDTQHHRIVVYETSTPPRSKAMEQAGMGAATLPCVLAFGTKGREPGCFQCPRGVAVRMCASGDADDDEAEHEILVCDSRNHRLQCFNPRGECVRGVGGRSGLRNAGCAGGPSGLFAFPMEVAVSPDGEHVVVADQRAITILTSALAPVTIVDQSQPTHAPSVGGTPLLSARLSYPTATRGPYAAFGVAPHAAGPGFMLYVAEYSTHQLREFALRPEDLDRRQPLPVKPTQFQLTTNARVGQMVLVTPSPRERGCAGGQVR